MPQSSPVPAAPLSERLRGGVGRRTLAIALVLAIEALLLLMLLSLSVGKSPGEKDGGVKLVRLDAPRAAEAAAEPPSDAAAEAPPVPQPPASEAPPSEPAPSTLQPSAQAQPLAPAPPVLTVPNPQAPSFDLPRPATPPALPRRPVYGPADPGRPAAYRDTERVGTAPNGEPLYAAAWYREPDKKMLGDYLSTASGPGWGLIDCRTARGYRVEDCVGIDEYPQGSQIMRAVLAAAWEFRVRPPRRGGREMVGSWVRIRIEYEIVRRPE